MAAYAALVSLTNNMEQIQNHPHLSTSLDQNQIESLREKVGFLLDFLESYNFHGDVSKEAEDLESQIASAAYAAEDVIESHVVAQILARSPENQSDAVDQILAGSTENESDAVDQLLAGSTEKSPSFLLNLQKIKQDIKKKVMKVQEKIHTKNDKSLLQKVMKDMDSIKKKIMKIEKKGEFKDQQPTYSMPAASSTPLTTGKTTMVGFDDELIQLMERLIGQQSNRQIIPIVGMGGIGKTTLARNIYEHSVIVQHFHVCVSATVSQGYSVKEILLELLSCQRKSTSETVDELGEQLHKSLSGKRYLIILDDIWSIEAWDKIKFFFPDNGNGSRIVITTRLSNVAIHFSSSSFVMNFLDEVKSWKLFCEKVFGQEDCPPELVNIGEKIVGQCKGLPLSIVVIGGLLRKSYETKGYGYWQNVAENINSILNSRENELVLSLSYSHLPAHLKPCFLYMGVFREDEVIRVSRLIKLWVAEGFLKPNGPQILEEVAEGYLKDLIDRNLVLVGRRGPNGKIKTCQIHDLLRDLCLRIAEKEKFFCVIRAPRIPRGIDRERRLIFHDLRWLENRNQVFHALQSSSLARSLICEVVDIPVKFRLLRVLNMDMGALNSYAKNMFQNVNLRYLTFHAWSFPMSMLPSSISLIWNLQTLIIRGVRKTIVAPVEVWKMPQLRHVEFDAIYLPDPPSSYRQDDFIVLGNLQTLLNVVKFRLSEDVCKRIPNIKKLNIMYSDRLEGYNGRLDYCLYINLGLLHKLESLHINFLFRSVDRFGLLKKNLMFPSSLKKLSLTCCHFRWEDLTTIGSLPQLEVLKLEQDSVVGHKWSPVIGEFLRLKFLRIAHCDLISWTADRSHFPVLEKLVLVELSRLNEIPWGIGEIPTLELIRLEWCSESANISAMKIKEEQESLGNDGLQIQLKIPRLSSQIFRKRVEMEGLTINNIQLEEGW